VPAIPFQPCLSQSWLDDTVREIGQVDGSPLQRQSGMALQRVRLQPQPHAGEGNQNPVTTGNCACADQNVRCVRAVFGGGLIDGASRDSIESGAFCFSKRYLAARSAAGRPAKKTNGSAPAALSGIHSIREASAQLACTSGLKPSACRVVDGRRIRTGMRNDRPRRVLGFATCETSHPELAETLEPTKRRQWRFGKQDASPCPPSPPRPPRD
jgi:hypothetical protein